MIFQVTVLALILLIHYQSDSTDVLEVLSASLLWRLDKTWKMVGFGRLGLPTQTNL